MIATEDTFAARRYFDSNFRSTRIHIEILPTEDCHSAPEHVLERLDQYRKQYQLGDDDELWLMLDTDHWTEPAHVANFTRVCQEATQKHCQLAHSNPCFDLWLLLHVQDIGASQFKNFKCVEAQLKVAVGRYNKRRGLAYPLTRETILAAISRAEKLDTAPAERWPQRTGSHVYRIVKKLL